MICVDPTGRHLHSMLSHLINLATLKRHHLVWKPLPLEMNCSLHTGPYEEQSLVVAREGAASLSVLFVEKMSSLGVVLDRAGDAGISMWARQALCKFLLQRMSLDAERQIWRWSRNGCLLVAAGRAATSFQYSPSVGTQVWSLFERRVLGRHLRR